MPESDYCAPPSLPEGDGFGSRELLPARPEPLEEDELARIRIGSDGGPLCD